MLRKCAPLLLALPLLLTSCINYRNVTFHGVKNVQVVPAEGSVLAFRIDAEVENPNGYRIRLKKPDVDLFYNGQHIGKGRLDSTVVLDKRCSKVYPVYVSADTKGQLGPMLLGGLGTLFTGKVEVEAKGTVLGQVGIFSKRFPFHVKEELSGK